MMAAVATRLPNATARKRDDIIVRYASDVAETSVQMSGMVEIVECYQGLETVEMVEYVEDRMGSV